MHPDQQVSENHGPIWTPPVWTDGPDRLVQMAKVDLFQDRADIEAGALETTKNSIAGEVPGRANEQEVLIPTTSNRNVAGDWHQSLKDLFSTEPLYGHTAPFGKPEQDVANPNA